MSSTRKKDPIKKLIKSVLSELIEENEDIIRRVFEEAIEDAVISKAIKDSHPIKKVSRKRIFETLANISR